MMIVKNSNEITQKEGKWIPYSQIKRLCSTSRILNPERPISEQGKPLRKGPYNFKLALLTPYPKVMFLYSLLIIKPTPATGEQDFASE